MAKKLKLNVEDSGIVKIEKGDLVIHYDPDTLGRPDWDTEKFGPFPDFDHRPEIYILLRKDIKNFSTTIEMIMIEDDAADNLAGFSPYSKDMESYYIVKLDGPGIEVPLVMKLNDFFKERIDKDKKMGLY